MPRINTDYISATWSHPPQPLSYKKYEHIRCESVKERSSEMRTGIQADSGDKRECMYERMKANNPTNECEKNKRPGAW